MKLFFLFVLLVTFIGFTETDFINVTELVVSLLKLVANTSRMRQYDPCIANPSVRKKHPLPET